MASKEQKLLPFVVFLAEIPAEGAYHQISQLRGRGVKVRTSSYLALLALEYAITRDMTYRCTCVWKYFLSLREKQKADNQECVVQVVTHDDTAPFRGEVWPEDVPF